MNLLVTGAAGFIGSHVCDRLLADGHRVVGLDSFDPFYPASLKARFVADAERHEAFTLIEGDVRHPEDLRRAGAAAEGPFDVVVHLAALAGVRPSIADPVRYESVNVGGTQRLLAWCRAEGVDWIVFGSSSSVGTRRRSS